MKKMPELLKLIYLAKNGDEDAFIQVVRRFQPVVKKYSYQMGYEDAFADLVVWIVNAVYRYQPKNTLAEHELNRRNKKN